MTELIRPKVGVAVFIIKDGQFVMGLRKGKHAGGTWGLPGGHLELGEGWEECARRETIEEVGLEIKNVRFLAVTNDIFTLDKHYVTIFMIADWATGEARILEPEKCQELAWFTLDRLPKEAMLPIKNLLLQQPNLAINLV